MLTIGNEGGVRQMLTIADEGADVICEQPLISYAT